MTLTVENPWRLAWLSGIALLALVFGGAGILQDTGLLSLTPPPSLTDVTPANDMPSAGALPLYQAALTAWATVILLIPAYIAVWRRNVSDQDWAIWLAFWTVSYVAYAIHIYVSAFWFFEGDFARMTASSRVSAFWPGMILLIWWPIDISVALKNRQESQYIKGQRLVLHVATFVLFFGGSAVKGELVTIKLLGLALAGATLVGMWQWIKGRDT